MSTFENHNVKTNWAMPKPPAHIQKQDLIFIYITWELCTYKCARRTVLYWPASLPDKELSRCKEVETDKS